MTVLESLLGQRQHNLTETVASRLALVPGKTNAERKQIKKSFKQDLYDLRSTLVHGDRSLLQTKTTIEDLCKNLCQARSFARQTFLWFLIYLDYVLEHTSLKDQTEIKIPNREEMLTALDIIGSKEVSKDKIRDLSKIMPDALSEWFAAFERA